MVAAVPAVERAGRMLAEMAEEPRRAFTASELSNVVGIHRATAASLLACLADLGMVERDPRTKMYRLGPETVRLGRAATDRYPGAEQARREIFGLANQFDLGGLVSVRVGDELIILEQVGTDEPEFALPAFGRYPLAPPFGAIFLAWSPADEIQRWLDRVSDSASPDEIESYRRSVTAIRARGYSIGSEEEVELQLEELLANLKVPESPDRLELALRLADLVRRDGHTPSGSTDGNGSGASSPSDDDVRSPLPRTIDHLVGPVFGPSGEVCMSLVLHGRPGQIREDNLWTFVDPLLQASARVTRAVGGRWARRNRSIT